MLQANELRRLNYIIVEGKIHKIVSIDENKIGTKRHDQISDYPIYRNYLDASWVEPIPLTEEILCNVKQFSHTHISKYRINICFMNNKEGVCTFKQNLLQTYLYCDFKRNVFYIKHNNQKIFIQYLHDLQNKIFYLLGYELQIEL